MTPETRSGSAQHWGPLWGARSDDWAQIEEQEVPTYEEALRRVAIEPGQRLLDIGCGTGVFLQMAAQIAGEKAVRAALVQALAPYRNSDGSYRLQNEWHYLVARAQ